MEPVQRTDDPPLSISLVLVKDERNNGYPELRVGSEVVGSKTAIVVELDDSGSGLSSSATISWDDKLQNVSVNSTSYRGQSSATVTYSDSSTGVQQADFGFTMSCTLDDSVNPASEAPSGWTFDSSNNTWSIDPYVRLKRSGFRVTQTIRPTATGSG